ncbi:lipopolysaccharide biosynthesis protein [Salinimicrobium sp. TIG7-5_MAKvit]|uniref:lipopolysaccharide biosynthesis protein n=1 Tax=Salinimicrobium sp. TIG7-5_MAKvit TaxID=3121289 RepID=UPI003C6E4A80
MAVVVGKSRIFSGMIWTTIQTLVNRSLGFLVKLVLARLLFPEDFGVVGMAAVFISFINVFNDLGIGAALIQRKKEKLREAHYHTAFWSGIVWSILVFLIVSFLIGPLAAWFYDVSILKLIVPALSLSILVSPINLVQKAQLTRDLKFKKLAYISNLSSFLAAIIALIMAFTGFGVWAIVANAVATNIIAVPFYFMVSKYIPKLAWDKTCFQEIFGFGIYTTANSLFGKITSNIDYLIVGKLLGAASLGIYTFAFIFTDVFRSQLMNIVKSVMFPVFSQLQNDPKILKNYYLKVVKINGLLVNPVMFGMILFSDPLIPYFFGEKWINSIELINILSLGVIVHMLVNSNSALFQAKGKVRAQLFINIFQTLFFFVPAIVIGTYLFDMVGTAYGFLIAKILSVIFILIMLEKLLAIKAWSVLKVSSIPLLISLISFTLVYFLKSYIFPVYLAIPTYALSVLVFSYLLEKDNVMFLVNKVLKRNDKE